MLYLIKKIWSSIPVPAFSHSRINSYFSISYHYIFENIANRCHALHCVNKYKDNSTARIVGYVDGISRLIPY